MAQPVFYIYSGAFIPGTLARAEAEAAEFTSVQVGFDKLAIQGVDSGAANAYVVTTSGAQNGQYSDGMVVEFKAANSNTGGSTIAVDSGATVGLTQPNGQALAAGAVAANTWYTCRYNSTYSAWTLIAPSSTVITSNTISAAAPTHLVGLTPAGGVSTAVAPIDVTFALDQTISPTMTGTWTFSGAVSFNSTVAFASGFTLTGGNNAYAITLDGSATLGQSYGVEINAGTNASDIAFLVNSHSGTQFFEILGTGGITVGAPTGGSQGAGTINATGLFVNGAAVKTTSISSANPSATIGLTAVDGSAATFMTSDSAPALSQAIVPTMTGAWTFTPSSAVTAVTINSPVNTIGLVLVGGTNTANTFLMSLQTGQGAGFSSGLYISAGTSSSDDALVVENAAQNTPYFIVSGDGSSQFTPNSSIGVTKPTVEIYGLSGQTDGWLGFVNQTTSTFIGGFGGGSLVNGQGVNDLAIYGVNNLIFGVGSGSTVDMKISGSSTTPKIQFYGVAAAGLVDMTPDTGTFTITYTGMNSTITGTAVWARVGNLVSLYFPAAAGTSDSTQFAATGLPAEIAPTRLQHMAIPFSGLENDSISALGDAEVVINGTTVTFWLSGSGTGWTNSGGKGVLNAFTISYLLN